MYADQDYKIIPIMEDGTDIGGGTETSSINMTNAHSVDIVVNFGDISVAGPRIQLTSAAAANTDTTSIAKSVKISAADCGAANADVFSVTVAPTTDETYTQPTHTQVDNRSLIMHVDASELTPGHNWIRLTFGSQATGAASAYAIVRPRYLPMGTMTAATA